MNDMHEQETGIRKRRIAAVVLLMSLFPFWAGCAMATPFRGPGFDRSKDVNAPGDEKVVVGLTYAKVGKNKALNRIFWDHTFRLHESLDSYSGLIGRSIRRRVFGDEAWTMTVWKDEASLNAFVNSPAHRRAVMEGSGALVLSRFARITVAKSRIPLPWKEAERILKEQGREYKPSRY